MSVDNDQILPDEKTRHWMVAQSHILLQDGKDKDLDQYSKVNQVLYDDAPVFENPSEVERARAKRAFSAVNEVIQKRDLNSDNIFEDLLSEKSFQLDRFTEVEDKKPSDELLDFAKNVLDDSDENEDAKIKKQIQAIMEEFAEPKAKGTSAYNKYEDPSQYGKEVSEPNLNVQK